MNEVLIMLHSRRNILGFTSLEAALSIVIITLTGIVGWYLFQTNQADDTTTIAKGTSASTASKPSVTKDFYYCSDNGGAVSDAKPFSCMLDGKTYAFPDEFARTQVTNLDKAPTDARALVISIASKNFSDCQSDPNTYPRTEVMAAQPNFVGLNVGCDGGRQRFIGLNTGVWTDLGSSQMGLSCEHVDTYQITKRAFIESNAQNAECMYTDGRVKMIPAS